jgi:putative CocE/NonD family hydrolase
VAEPRHCADSECRRLVGSGRLLRPIKIYELLERHDTAKQNFLVVGPWNHGGWSRGEGSKLGRVDFGSPTAAYYRRNILAPFFGYYLKGHGAATRPEALTFRTGENKWIEHSEWPPKRNVTERKLYLQAERKLSFAAPLAKDSAAFDSYVSDPANPVPYRPRPIQVHSGWTTWLVEDQRFVDRRPDVLTWESDTLTEDVTVSGRIVANLFASTSGTDSDWIVKVIDVYPDKYEPDASMSGFQLMIAGDVFRGRYLQSFEKPAALAANRIYRVPNRISGERSHVQTGPPHHGPGSEHLVSGNRSQSANICREHLPRAGV